MLKHGHSAAFNTNWAGTFACDPCGEVMLLCIAFSF